MTQGFIVPIILVSYLWFACCAGPAATPESDRIYHEPYRSEFHFTPTKNWMNDPNGPIFYQGEYHLFYQYNPYGNEWGHMSWGHAISRDLVHWQHLPVAIPEENGVMAFSGSTVVDWQNSSALCKGSKQSNSSCLIAIYTGYTGTLQKQNLAYSNDNGRTWSEYSGNPILDLGLRNFRDPKVFWHELSHKWIMVAALSDQHKVRFFGSKDLKHWTALSDFGPAGATGGVWECPDLFELPIDGEPGQKRWLLSVNINPGAVAGGSGNQYFVGEFDGKTFTNESASDEAHWVDYGKDFYASTSFANVPADRRTWLGWLDNWEYAGKLPTYPWRGTQSIPRILRLRRLQGEIRLIQQPVPELTILRAEHMSLEGQSFTSANGVLHSSGIAGDTLEIVAEIAFDRASEFGIFLHKGRSEQTVVGVDVPKSELFVDRTKSGQTDFDPRFPGRHAAPLHPDKVVKLHILLDRQSVEVFANDGEAVISDCIFSAPESRGVEVYSKGGEARLLKFDIWKLRSIWQ